MSRRAGFTLIETLFSFLMVMLVLGALGKTLVNAGQVRSNRVNMDRAAEELHALNSIRSDIFGCLTLLEPPPAGSSAIVRLQRVDPGLTFAQRTDVTRGPELPFEPSEQIAVVYRVEDGVLQRVVTPEGAPPRVERLLACTALEARREGALVTLTLSFSYSRVEKKRTLRLDLR